MTSLVARLRAAASHETAGGVLLLLAAVAALVLANSPARGWYESLSETVVGPAVLHLDLTLAQWATDGLLAIFFLVVGLELKHELAAGNLRDPRHAAVPMLAAVGGMVLPALVFAAAVLALDDGDALHGWAIPTATDIAFALAVLAVFGKGLPAGIRTFLLTLAVVDDLLAIVVIAVFYTGAIHWWALAAALAAVALAAWLVRARRPRWWLVAPVAVAAWALMHASGVHATVAGVLVGLVVPAHPAHGEATARTERWAATVQPWSQTLALPLFAFFAAGVTVLDDGGIGHVLGQPVVLAVGAGLVLGKVTGVLGTVALVTRLTPLRLQDGLALRDLLPIGFLAGIGFTVALLVSELSFGHTATQTAGAKAAILLASALAAVLGAACLRWDATRRRPRT